MSQEGIFNDNKYGNEGGIIDPEPRRHYQRCTQERIQRLQQEFDRNPHPIENERQAIGEALGLDPLRVKFWFQNRRSQLKKKGNKELHKQLLEENKILSSVNAAYKNSLQEPICQNCGGPGPSEVVQHLRKENQRIKQEIIMATNIMENYYGKRVESCPVYSEASSTETSDLGFEG